MNTSLVLSTTDEEARPMTGGGQSVHPGAAQIRHHIATRLGQDHADFLAEPVFGSEPGAVDWYGPGEGPAPAIDELEPATKSIAATKAMALLDDIGHEAERLIRSADSGERVLGAMLARVRQIPGPQYLRARGTTPILRAWCHSLAGESVDAVAILATVPKVDPVEPPPPPPVAPPVEPAPPPPPTVSSAPVAAPPLDPAPAIPPASVPIVVPPAVTVRTRLTVVTFGWVSLLIFLVTAGSTFALAAQFDPALASRLRGWVGLGDTTSEDDLRRAIEAARRDLALKAADCAPPPTIKQAALPPPPKPELKPTPKPDPKPVVTPPTPPVEARPFDKKTMEKKDAKMFQGCWQRQTNMVTVNIETGERQAVDSWRTCFDAPSGDGSVVHGTQTIRWHDGKTCTGPVEGAFQPDGSFGINDTEKCSGDKLLNEAKYVCTRADDAHLTCSWTSRGRDGELRTGQGVELTPDKP